MLLTDQTEDWILSFTKDDWEAYLDSPDSVVGLVNMKLLEAIEDNYDAYHAQGQIYQYLDKLSEDGYADSEPRQFVTNVLNKVYGSDIHRWESILTYA